MRNIFFLLVIIIFSVTCLNAQNVVDISLTKNSNKIYISARLDTDISDEIFELLYNGVEVTLVYTIKIYKERPFYYIMDSNIKTIDYKKVVRFKLREKQYYLFENKKKEKISSRKELNKKLKKINKVFLIGEKVLKKGAYYLKIQASLESVKMLPPIVWFFDWLDVGKFKTPWVKKKIK